MSIPKPKKSDLTKSHILSTALALFQEHGFEKTTMRMIATACELSLGAAYYHFETKEALVLHFYAQTSAEAREYNQQIIAGSSDFKERMSALLTFKLDQMASFRELAAVLARQAADWNHPLSPFSAQSAPMRNEAIGLIDEVIAGSNLKASAVLRPHLAKILWLYQMGVILFWVNDASESQERTRNLIGLSLGLIEKFIRASALPFMRGLNQSAVKIVELVEGSRNPSP
jgi:AcrR family transcriptional regulator